MKATQLGPEVAAAKKKEVEDRKHRADVKHERRKAARARMRGERDYGGFGNKNLPGGVGPGPR